MERIGTILQSISPLPPAALEAASTLQQERGGALGEILRQQKQISEIQLLTALGRQFGLEVATVLDSTDAAELCRRTPSAF